MAVHRDVLFIILLDALGCRFVMMESSCFEFHTNKERSRSIAMLKRLLEVPGLDLALTMETLMLVHN